MHKFHKPIQMTMKILESGNAIDERMALLLEVEPPLFEVCKKNKIGTYQVC